MRIFVTDHALVTEATGWRPQIGVEAILREIGGWLETEKGVLEPILG